MSAKETAVRDAARKLHDAIKDATSAGLVVSWPSGVAGLQSIAISETAKAPAAAPARPAPAKPKA